MTEDEKKKARLCFYAEEKDKWKLCARMIGDCFYDCEEKFGTLTLEQGIIAVLASCALDNEDPRYFVNKFTKDFKRVVDGYLSK